MSPELARWEDAGDRRKIEAFFSRPAVDPECENAARKILESVRTGGDRAVVEFAREFDGSDLKESDLAVHENEIDEAASAVSEKDRKAIQEAIKRVSAFAEKGMRKDWRMKSPHGGILGEQFVPFDRVGVYVPGGAAPLVSTVIMTVTLGKTAGVKEIAACTPSRKQEGISPEILYALGAAGATEIYRVGGVHAVGMMAYGTETVRKVRKIVGPGGPYVTAAKKLVYGDTALDLVAGPSEIAVIADETAEIKCIAADLLSQVEHGTGWERALLVTTSPDVAKKVAAELEIQCDSLSRRKQAARVMQEGMLFVITGNIEEAVEVCNRFAPEHLELMTENPEGLLSGIRAAGAVFLGKWSPECAGDFVAGPSHVLPTGGTAGMFSGLTVDDFRLRTSLIGFNEEDLKETLPVIEAFGKMEGLDGHARSARLRFE